MIIQASMDGWLRLSSFEILLPDARMERAGWSDWKLRATEKMAARVVVVLAIVRGRQAVVFKGEQKRRRKE